jgi:hypothetical protein
MIDRKLYKGYFLREGMNNWMCPTCNKGTLQIDKGKFIYEDNFLSKLNMNNEDFNPYDIVYTYTALLTCTNAQCKEVVTSSGTGRVDVVGQALSPEGYTDTEYGDYFQPHYFYPPLHIFKIPINTPDNVKKSIKSSFSLVFTNRSAAANQVRIAIECLLTHLKVKQFTIIRGRRNRINLHRRIELLATKHQKIKEFCLAIKWLGNAGSHCDEEMEFDDIFNGYDMLSFILEELYDNKHTHVRKLAKKINDKKGV